MHAFKAAWQYWKLNRCIGSSDVSCNSVLVAVRSTEFASCTFVLWRVNSLQKYRWADGHLQTDGCMCTFQTPSHGLSRCHCIVEGQDWSIDHDCDVSWSTACKVDVLYVHACAWLHMGTHCVTCVLCMICIYGTLRDQTKAAMQISRCASCYITSITWNFQASNCVVTTQAQCLHRRGYDIISRHQDTTSFLRRHLCSCCLQPASRMPMPSRVAQNLIVHHVLRFSHCTCSFAHISYELHWSWCICLDHCYTIGMYSTCLDPYHCQDKSW